MLGTERSVFNWDWAPVFGFEVDSPKFQKAFKILGNLYKTGKNHLFSPSIAIVGKLSFDVWIQNDRKVVLFDHLKFFLQLFKSLKILSLIDFGAVRVLLIEKALSLSRPLTL